MAKRVYELSKELGISSKDLLKLLHENGVELASHVAVVPSDIVEKITKQLQSKVSATKNVEAVKAKASDKVVEKVDVNQPKKSDTTKINAPDSKQIKTKTTELKNSKVEKHKPNIVKETSMQQTQINEKNIAKSKEPAELVLVPMTVSDFAEIAKKPVSEIILTLLRQGVVAAKNQIISVNVISSLAETYGIKTSQKVLASSQAITKHEKVQNEGAQVERLPIVVVIGHVDHGKTSLLDYIRKTRVAAREKGGITQHLGAYEVKTSQGSIVFLDTPGHEAFSLMRVRGIKVADIAILVVAADDGVMPQTIEAIKAAKSIGLPIIVAINKMDKASEQQVEVVKRQLAQHDLLTEDWGGQTVAIGISAKFGQGIDELLDVVSLQAQLMELTASVTANAQGYVLESGIEKGRGAVATVILHDGVLKVGDFFKSGTTRGKISSIVDSYGKRLLQVGPSLPVQIAGFESLPQAGDKIEAISHEEFKKNNMAESAEIKPFALQKSAEKNAINIIVKTDNASSKEAILNAIEKLSKKSTKEFHVIDAAVGSVKDSDVTMASDTGSIIYTFHIKPETSALLLSQRLNVQIRHFDIIYKLLENMEALAEEGKKVKMVSKKIGEAVVLKVFDIKGLGVIAGAQVKTGIFNRAGKVVVYRGKFKVGEGAIKSLQRDKKTVKDVHAGFECAFLIDGFDAWQPDDRVECFLEVPAE